MRYQRPQIWGADKPISVVSLGTGGFQEDLNDQFVDIFNFESVPLWKRGVHEVGAWLQLLQQIISSATSSEPTERLMEEFAKQLVEKYSRFDPEYAKEVPMDTVDKQQLEYMMEVTQKYIEEHINEDHPLFGSRGESEKQKSECCLM